MLNPWLALVAVVLLGGAYASGRYDGSRIAVAKEARAEDVRRQAGEAMTAAAVNAITKLRPVFTTINQPLQKEFHNEVRYTSADCAHTDTAWSLLDRAYQVAGGQPFSDRAGMPTPSAAP